MKGKIKVKQIPRRGIKRRIQEEKEIFEIFGDKKWVARSLVNEYYVPEFLMATLFYVARMMRDNPSYCFKVKLTLGPILKNLELFLKNVLFPEFNEKIELNPERTIYDFCDKKISYTRGSVTRIYYFNGGESDFIHKDSEFQTEELRVRKFSNIIKDFVELFNIVLEGETKEGRKGQMYFVNQIRNDLIEDVPEEKKMEYKKTLNFYKTSLLKLFKDFKTYYRIKDKVN